MNWDDLRVFLAIARDGSLSAAARHLKVSQPTVGRRLAALEDSLSARLFDRQPDGFVLTAAGSELLPMAEAMEQAADAVDRKQAGFADHLRGTVRLSIYEIMAQFLTAHMWALRERLPDIEVELSVAHIGANLSKREADLLIRECLPESPGLIARKLGRFAYAVYGANDLVGRQPMAHGDGRYQACPWVGFDEDHTYFAGAKWLLERRQGRPTEIRVNNGMVLHDLVRKGAGLGILPCFAGDADRALVRLTPPLADVQSSHHLIVHRDLRRVPAVRAVMDAVTGLFEDQAAALAGRSERAAAVGK
ncbi:MAG: LysR family transcriptional regulator [Alphaproteobacteria bacterium]|jgi:DNA-binding transcriptional LysR family regulator|nr:LysR family transcriptional regulator [Alphaproteobacteria bacterium]MDP6563538.1 LysR family transcriptional regulator [Alphaproteobacteria bacterium]MDP6815537.1 LysR family transcriptional regulator [Alphaproteobacteria bacterium]